MRTRHAMLGAWVAGTLLALSALPAGADEETQSAAGEAPNKIIAGLRQITGELTDSVKQFEACLLYTSVSPAFGELSAPGDELRRHPVEG